MSHSIVISRFRSTCLSLRTASVSGALALAGSSAAALVPPQCDALPFQEGNFVCTPSGVTGPYRGIVAGDLNGDWTPELAAIKGEHLIVYHNPAIGNDAVVVGASSIGGCSNGSEPVPSAEALDLCFVHDVDGTGQPGLFFTSPDGLERVRFDDGENCYFAELVDTDPTWRGARLIRASIAVGFGAREGLIGVTEDGLKLFRCLPSGDGFTAPAVFASLAHEIMDITLLNYVGSEDGPVEIGILHQNGIQIRYQEGGIVLARSGILPGDAIATVRKQGTTDSLAWVTSFPGAGSNLLLFNSGFPLYQGPLPIGDRTFDSVVGSDLDGDGDDDLVLGASSWTTLQVLLSEPSETKWFSTDADQVGEVEMALDGESTGPFPEMGRVLCANLYNDWYSNELPIPAFVLAVPGSAMAELGSSEPGGLRLRPQLEARYAEFGWSADFKCPRYETAPHGDACAPAPGSTTRSRWSVKLGGGWGLTNATHVQMIVRKCDSDLTVPDELNHHVEQTELAATGQIDGTLLDFFGVEDVSDPEDSPVRYFIEVRPVRVNPSSGLITRVWRWSILGVSADCEGFAWLFGLPGVESDPIPIHFETCLYQPPLCPAVDEPEEAPEQEELVTRYIPSAVPQSRIPSPGPGVLPEDGQE